MDKLKELARKAWAKYRSWPMWGQILGGVVVVSIIVGPFLDANKEKDTDPRPTDSATVASDVTAPDTTAVTTSTTAPSAAASTDGPTTSVPTTSTTVTASAPSCQDARNDGAGGFDLLDAALQSMGGSRTALATFVGPSPGRDVFVSFILSRDQDGEDYAYQIGVTRSPDGSVTAYVFDVGETKNTDLDTAVFDDGRVQVSIPDELLSEIRGNNVNFQVDLNVDGNDIDSCP